jgi:DNA polymerase II small subunit
MSDGEATPSEELNQRLTDRGLTVVKTAREALLDLDEPTRDAVIDELERSVSHKPVITTLDIDSALDTLDSESAGDTGEGTDQSDPPAADATADNGARDTTDDDDAPSEKPEPVDEDESADYGAKTPVAADGPDDEGEAEDEPDGEGADEEEDDDGYGFRWKIRDTFVTRITAEGETAPNTEAFEEDNPNLTDPFGAIAEFDDHGPERSTEHRDIVLGRDIARKSVSEGDVEDFVKYFRNRYEKLSKILRKRVNAQPVNSLHKSRAGQDVSVIGMVYETRPTKKGNKFVELEDTTGASIPVVFSDDEQKEQCERLVSDEVVAVTGQLSNDGNIIFGDELFFPGVSRRWSPTTADREVNVALLSDIHFGAREFAVDKWNAFVEWMHTRPDIEYLLVSGDIIEGVGIYYGQKDQLSVELLTDQYKLCAHAFDQLPSDLDIVVIPGNHDGIPLVEPQPSFGEDVRKEFGDNVHWGGNPSYVTIEGVTFLLYHGVSLNPVIDALPFADIQEPTSAMWPLLEKRHVAPQYGTGSLRIAPEHEDYLVMDQIPDVFVTGHVHTADFASYLGVEMVNTGTFQHQTQYQRDLDVVPDVGYVCTMNLGDLSKQVFYF